MKNLIIKKIQSKLNYILDLPISFVEMGLDSVVESKTKKELKLIEKLYIYKVGIITYNKNNVVIKEETVSYESLPLKLILLIDMKLISFNKDLNDKVLIDLVDSIIN